jgi:hypothetical protein
MWPALGPRIGDVPAEPHVQARRGDRQLLNPTDDARRGTIAHADERTRSDIPPGGAAAVLTQALVNWRGDNPGPKAWPVPTELHSEGPWIADQCFFSKPREAAHVSFILHVRGRTNAMP